MLATKQNSCLRGSDRIIFNPLSILVYMLRVLLHVRIKLILCE
jgi:hypothetical protein